MYATDPLERDLLRSTRYGGYVFQMAINLILTRKGYFLSPCQTKPSGNWVEPNDPIMEMCNIKNSLTEALQCPSQDCNLAVYTIHKHLFVAQGESLLFHKTAMEWHQNTLAKNTQVFGLIPRQYFCFYDLALWQQDFLWPIFLHKNICGVVL